MTDTPKVCYAITSNCYSAYGIDAVFTTRELAERALSLIPDNDDTRGYGSRIEEFSLDDVEAYEREAEEYRKARRTSG